MRCNGLVNCIALIETVDTWKYARYKQIKQFTCYPLISISEQLQGVFHLIPIFYIGPETPQAEQKSEIYHYRKIKAHWSFLFLFLFLHNMSYNAVKHIVSWNEVRCIQGLSIKDAELQLYIAFSLILAKFLLTALFDHEMCIHDYNKRKTYFSFIVERW